jgi:PAS domain S-box-containing protein
MMNPRPKADNTRTNNAVPDALLPPTETTTMTSLPKVTMAAMTHLLALSPDATIIVDQTGRIVLVNEQAATLFDYRPEDLIGHSLEILLPERLRAVHVAHRTDYAAAPRLRPMGAGLELTGRRKDNSEFPVEVSLRPVLLKGTLHIIGAIRDMTAQHVLKREHDQQDEFIEIAAHELRTPLAVLKGVVSTLLVQTAQGHGPRLADWQYETLQELEQATDRLSKLAEDLLDISYLQAGQLFLRRRPTNLVTLAQSVVDQIQPTTTQHHIEIHTEHSLLEAYIDPKRIEQVLTNLIMNAIKYSPQGGPVIVTLSANEATHMVNFHVQDAGMGIPKHQQAQIFGRFVRANNARAAGISGTGLGLYLCRMLVEQHGGQLWFESTESEGTTFFLTLPLITPLLQTNEPSLQCRDEQFRGEQV